MQGWPTPSARGSSIQQPEPVQMHELKSLSRLSWSSISEMPGGLLRRLAGSAMDKEAPLDHFLVYRLHEAYRSNSPARQLWRVAAQHISAPKGHDMFLRSSKKVDVVIYC
ncbi:uncharacterized protein LOC119275358 [Triticum dicoccoides]|uniref:uncharacterized protein LOC119275358 n=1 Tax=Triticum dicoccoides TaxID=85692 RepID=UPI00188FECB5|nr:uncharacterized protein LOC119275358 [Triticum dicoccoides]